MNGIKRIVAVFLLTSCTVIAISPSVFAVQDAPSYAKWGRKAMIIAKEKYPSADIVDYQHIGKDTKKQTEIEKFKLWMRQKDQEFGLFISIEYVTESQEIISIRTVKTER